MTVCDIQRQTLNVEGFLSQNGDNLREGETLYHLARKYAPSGDIAEIGSWKGKSTIWLAKGAEGSKCRVYAIDHHQGSPEHQMKGKKVNTFHEFQQNISNFHLSDKVVPILKKSQDAVNDTPQLNLLFIDGAHEYEAVKQDLKLWFPKVKRGGCIAFHDTSLPGWSGVRKLVIEEVFKSSKFKSVRYMNSITYAIKTDHATLLERMQNRVSLFVNQMHQRSRTYPRLLKSLVKHFIWLPFHKRWFKDLESK